MSKYTPIPMKAEIYREGTPPFHLFYIEKGQVKTFKTNEDGKELIAGLYGPGEYFGYTNLINDETYSDSAAALGDCKLSLIPKSDFNDLVHKNRQVSKKFMSILSSEVISQEERLIQLAYNSVRKRVSEALIKFFEHQDETVKTKGLKISREDISNVAGTSLETAIRTLSDFKEEKLIELGRIAWPNSDVFFRLEIFLTAKLYLSVQKANFFPSGAKVTELE